MVVAVHSEKSLILNIIIQVNKYNCEAVHNYQDAVESIFIDRVVCWYLPGGDLPAGQRNEGVLVTFEPRLCNVLQRCNFTLF